MSKKRLRGRLFFVVDTFGKELAYRVASFKAEDSSDDLKSNFKGLVGLNIPPGGYRYRLERREAQISAPLNGTVKVFNPDVRETLVAAALNPTVDRRPATVTFITPRDFLIKGKVVSREVTVKSTWIRFQAAFNSYHVDVTVDESGSFRILEPLEGIYEAVWFSGAEIIGGERIRFEQGHSNGQPEIS